MTEGATMAGMAQALLEPRESPEPEALPQFPLLVGRTGQRHEQAALVRTIGERMRQAREMCNLSQSQAAHRLGYANSSKLSKVESATDTNSVPILLILRAAQMYGVSVDYLFGTSESAADSRDVVGAANAWLASALEAARQRDLQAIEQTRRHIDGVAQRAAELVRAALAACEGLTQFAEINPRFETTRGSATLARRMEVLQASASATCREFHRLGLRHLLSSADL